MTARLIVVSLVLFGAAAYLDHATRPEIVAPREPLAMIPMQVGSWRGYQTAPFDREIVKVLGVDEYVNRFYVDGKEPFINLYVGFYKSQRQGDTIHSPLNCLPGAGWQPVQKDRARIMVTDVAGTRPIDVNQFVIQKGVDRQLVLYWYQSHGRIVANEYRSRMLMVYDAIRLNRSDAAMIRVVTPLADAETDSSAAARRAAGFVQALFPTLQNILPS